MNGILPEVVAIVTIYAIWHVGNRTAERLILNPLESRPEHPYIPLPTSYEMRLALHQLVVVALTASGLAFLWSRGGSYFDYLRWWGVLLGPLLVGMMLAHVTHFRAVRVRWQTMDLDATPYTDSDDFNYGRLLRAIAAIFLVGFGLFFAGQRPAGRLELQHYEAAEYSFSYPSGWERRPEDGILFFVPPAGFHIDDALLSLDTDSDFATDKFVEGLMEMELTEQTDIEINGAHSATREEGSFTILVVNETYDMVRLRVRGMNGVFYRLEIVGEPGSLDQLDAIADQIFPTFEVSEAS